MARAFKLRKGVDPREITILPYLLRLMMSIDAMRSAVRWVKSHENGETHIVETDRLMGALALIGWAYQGIKLIHEGLKRNPSWISRDMLEDDEQSLKHWDVIVSVKDKKPNEWPDGTMKRIGYIRDKCFGHWDPEIANDWIERQASSGEDVPFIESESGAFLDTRFTWANAALASAFCQDPTPEARREAINDLLRFSMRTTRLLSYLATDLSKEHNLQFEEVVN